MLYVDQQAKTVLCQQGIGGDFRPGRFGGSGDDFGILKKDVYKVVHQRQNLNTIQWFQRNR
jgi:hypothetical protein